MKNFLFIILFAMLSGLSGVQAQNVSTFFDEADAFFGRYVKQGKVDYATLNQEPAALVKLIMQIRSFSPETLSESEQEAFWVNAYNLLVIQSVIADYPISSPQQVNGFFDANKHLVAGKEYTLNGLEKTEILDKYEDARHHFVLVCAALSCPPIIPEAYKPATLQAQLTQQSKAALNDPSFIQVNDAEKTVSLSQIFNWYKKDFTRDGKTILEFINSYREQAIPADYKIRYYEYDWTINALGKLATTNPTQDTTLSNVQLFTPSVLLNKGQFQVKFFNNLYTQTAFRDADREKVDLNERQTFYTGIIQIDLGVAKSSRINVGLELNINSVRYDSDPNSSPLRLFNSGGSTLAFNRTTIGSIGPRIRVNPFRSIPKFSFTSTLVFPLQNDLESPRFLAHNRPTWWTQFFYDKIFGDFQIFGEIDFLFRFPTDNESFTNDAFFRTPATVFLSYFPNSKMTVNVNYQYSPAFTGLPGNDSDQSFELNRWFMQVGAGFKYQLTQEINLELLYTNFVASKGEGAGQTFNFGIVFIR